MKTYQIKAERKNQKPPVWRRCIIPGGITYSQLAVLLTELLEIKGEEPFTFEFYQKKIRFQEKDKDGSLRENFYYDMAEAPKHTIDVLFQTESWFSFLMGEEKFRVTIEKELEDWENPWPEILLSRRWPGEASVNQRMKEFYTITPGETDRRSREEILAEKAAGIRGLAGNPAAEDGIEDIERSGQFYMKEMADALKEKFLSNQKMERITVRNILDSASADALRGKAERLRPGAGQGKSKEELIDFLERELLKPETMEDQFLFLNDHEIAAWEFAVKAGGAFCPEEGAAALYDSFCDMGYMASYVNGMLEVAADAEKCYKMISGPEASEGRKKKKWLLDCLYMHQMICGAAPISVMVSMCGQRKDLCSGREEFLRLFEELPEDKKPCVIQDGRVIEKSLLGEKMYRRLEEIQGDKGFGIPSPREIEICADCGYPAENRHYKRLIEYLTGTLQAEEETAVDMARFLWAQIAFGYDIFDMTEEFFRRGIFVKNMEQRKELLAILQDMERNTRMAANGGQTPNQLLGRAAQAERGEDLFSSGGSRGKIYPNDPCPCGSGKKYKKCCGKRS